MPPANSLTKTSKPLRAWTTWAPYVKFYNKFASNTKRKGHSEYLQGLTVASFEDGGRSEREAFDTFDRVAPMALRRDSSPDARMIFLVRAVQSQKWELNSMNGLKPDTYSYLELIDVLYEAQARDKRHRKAWARESAESPSRDGFRQSRWKQRKGKDGAKGVYNTGLHKPCRNQGSISRRSTLHLSNYAKHDTPSIRLRNHSPCFNCEDQNCKPVTCKHTYDGTKIVANLDKYRQERAHRWVAKANVSNVDSPLQDYMLVLEEVLIYMSGLLSDI